MSTEQKLCSMGVPLNVHGAKCVETYGSGDGFFGRNCNWEPPIYMSGVPDLEFNGEPLVTDTHPLPGVPTMDDIRRKRT